MSLYQNYYLPSVSLSSGWTGSIVTGDPGTLSDTFRQGIVRRINYFRAMSGVGSSITFDAADNAMCQQAALMMSAAQNISHTPPLHLALFTPPPPPTACASSDIRLDWQGDEGAGAIDNFMADSESNNTYVGHRRWLVYPGEDYDGQRRGARRRVDVSPATNATWVLSIAARPADARRPRRAGRPAGFVPAALVFNRWSFSYVNADFSAATVSVTQERRGDERAAGGPSNTQSKRRRQRPVRGRQHTLVWELPANVVKRHGGRGLQGENQPMCSSTARRTNSPTR